MIHLLPVGQLMDHHIVQDLLRRQHQQAVEVQISPAGAAAPAGLLAADGDIAEGDTHRSRVTVQLFRQTPAHLFRQGQNFFFTQGGLLPLGVFRQYLSPVGLDPLGFFLQKGLDFPLGHPQWGPDLQISFLRNANGEGFSPGTDQPCGGVR